MEGLVRETSTARAAAPWILLPGAEALKLSAVSLSLSLQEERGRQLPFPGSTLAEVMAGQGSDLARGPSAFRAWPQEVIWRLYRRTW